MVQGAFLWLASPNDLQHAIEIFLGYGIVGIELQSGPQVGFGGCQMSLIHVHEPQITVGQVAVRIESLYQLEFRLRLRIVFLIEPMDAQLQVRFVVAWIDFNRSTEMSDGFIALSEGRPDKTEAAVSFCVVRVDPKLIFAVTRDLAECL